MSVTAIDDETLSWLTSVPIGDGNFKSALDRANEATIKAALQQIKGRSGVSTKEDYLNRRLRKLTKGDGHQEVSAAAAGDTAARQIRTTEIEISTLQAEREADDLRSEQQREREGLIAQTHEMIGRIQGFKAISEFADVGRLVWLKQMKESKIYRDLPNVGTWDKFCNYIGLSRQKVDEDLTNLAAFGDKFLTTVGSFSLGYRELRKLRQLTSDGSIVIEAECIQIGEEKIPINEDHAEDLQVAIERVLEEKQKLDQRVTRLEKDVKGVVEEETRGLKAEVNALVKEVRRLKPFDPGEKDVAFAEDQMEGIKGATLNTVALMSSFLVDERVQQEPRIMGQVEGYLQTMELALQDLRRRWELAANLFEA